MNHQTEALRQALAAKVEELWQEVSWDTPREKADRLRREAIQLCHALHRAANPAYRERCERERIGERLELAQIPAVVFPEEIYKAYSEKERGDGKKLGVFCEQDVPLLLEHLNHYLVHPITMDGLAENYMQLTNIKGGLDRLRADLLRAQELFLLTSSGTSGSALSLIPFDKASFETLRRVTLSAYDEFTTVPGYGPIDPAQHCLVAHAPRSGSMMMALAFKFYASEFGPRAFVTIPADVQTRELRWRTGAFTGVTGRILKLFMKPLSVVGGRQTHRKSLENLVTALRSAEALGVRTAVFANPWMAYEAMKQIEVLLADEIARGTKKPGDPFVQLAPGSVLIIGGGNKSGLDITEEETVALCRRVIGGLEWVTDGYGQAEGYGSGIRCAEGNYHLDPHAEYFTVDSYLAFFDPRQTNRVPAILSGDLVGAVHEEPCPCGAPTRYFKRIQRDDQKRGSKGCAAALAEYG